MMTLVLLQLESEIPWITIKVTLLPKNNWHPQKCKSKSNFCIISRPKKDNFQLAYWFQTVMVYIQKNVDTETQPDKLLTSEILTTVSIMIMASLDVMLCCS